MKAPVPLGYSTITSTFADGWFAIVLTYDSRCCSSGQLSFYCMLRIMWIEQRETRDTGATYFGSLKLWGYFIIL